MRKPEVRTTPDQLVTLTTCPNSTEAGFVKNLLEAEGIRIFLTDEALVGLLPLLGNAMGWVKVQINEKDMRRASEILTDRKRARTDLRMESFSIEHVDTPTAIEAAECESSALDDDEPETDVSDPMDELASRAFRAAVIGLICFPVLFYAAWLIARMLFSQDELSDSASQKLWLAFGIALVVFIVYWIVFAHPFAGWHFR